MTGDIPVYGNGKTLTLTNGTAFGGVKQATSYFNAQTSIPESPLSVTPPSGTNDLTGILGLVRKTDNKNSGLIADLSSASSVTVNALRIAFATQKAYEKDARGGTRYVEMIKSHFGVNSPDARQQRPEYLGGNRIPINVNQVVQNSGEIGNTPLGNVAGYSVTSDSHGDFIKSFTEHGFAIVTGKQIGRASCRERVSSPV